MNDPSPAAHVHRRIQPYHDEHRDYVRWATNDSSSDRLIVGITNADESHTTPTDADPERHRPENNPFTYCERYWMIQSALADTDLSCEISIVPFPINRPELWNAYAPPSAVHYINILEEWHEHKVDQLQNHGRTVRSKHGTRTISGTGIRRLMAAGDRWDDRVPDSVVAVVRRRGLVERVRELYDNGDRTDE
jgi:nicotinamide-nucleotide adenylyltransferase